MQNKTQQLLDMIDNYGIILEEEGIIDEIIIYVSGKIYEANKLSGYVGYNFNLDDREDD